jgi:hypothetical protein
LPQDERAAWLGDAVADHAPLADSELPRSYFARDALAFIAAASPVDSVVDGGVLALLLTRPEEP